MSQNNPSTEAAEQLTDDAFAALEAGRAAEVAEICARLRAMNYSSFFEIEALLYLDQGQPLQALEILEEGNREVPDLWLLWQLRGNILSDAGQFEEALDCYERALPIEGADRDSLYLNRATALWRDGRAPLALQEVEATDETRDDAPTGLRWRLEALHLNLWGELGRCDEANARAAELFAEQQDLELDADEAAETSVAFSQIGWAMLGCGQSEPARAWARAALEIDRINGQALLLARDATPDLPFADQTFRVVLAGRLEDEDEPTGFFTTISVIAPDAARARELALAFESPRWESAVRVEDCARIGSCESQPSCVYEVQGYISLPLDES